MLSDPTGDVVISHCDLAESPAQGFEAMDLTALDVEELPDAVRFSVSAAGLTEESGPDAGNYFVHMMRGEKHYVLRMYQDNAGTGAIAELLVTEGVNVFGTKVAEVPADVEENTITAYAPRVNLRDQDHAPFVRGQTLDDILVAAEAHATGAYFCDFEGSAGPAIIQDRMPDGWIGQGGTLAAQYGGAIIDGPMDLVLWRPFHASNGEETTYTYQPFVTNLADEDRTFTFNVTAPSGWTVHVPEPLTLEPGEEARPLLYAEVPFFHVHGETVTGSLTVSSEDAQGEVDFGVHYLDIAQPAGHHRSVFIHSYAGIGGLAPANAALGGGDNPMFFNTLEEDPRDHDLPMSGRNIDGELVWYGCLSPDLKLGIQPDVNSTGRFSFTFDAALPVSGTLSGIVSILPDDYRPATCARAEAWSSTPVLSLDPVDVSLNGVMEVHGEISSLTGQRFPYMGGSDLLLEIRLTPETPHHVGGTVDLLPGSSMHLPLLDFVNDRPSFEAAEGEVPDGGADGSQEAPGPGIALMVGLILVAGRRALK